jgi:hypothetical protein
LHNAPLTRSKLVNSDQYIATQSLTIRYGVNILVTFALGKHWAIDRSADPKGKLQLTIF